MHRIALQKTIFNTNCCINRTYTTKLTSTIIRNPSTVNRQSWAKLRNGAIRSNLKPAMVTTTPLLSALSIRHVDKKKAVRIGSKESPATPSEIEVAENTHQSKYLLVRICHRIIKWLDDYIVEPILTLRRLTHILLLFIPVALTVPIVFFGQKVDEEDKTGTLWWYDFLATQMERAGPTFIKVKKESYITLSYNSFFFFVASTMGCF